MKELEAKFRVKCEDLGDLRSRIQSLGFNLVEVVSEVDYYYNHPCRDFRVTDEAIRVRVVSNGRVELTYKGPRVDGEFKLRDEYVVYVNSMTIAKILELLGFKQVVLVEKRREYYSKGSITISLDEVRGLGCFLELEVRNGDVGLVKSLIEDLGLSMDYYEPKTYLELLIERS